MTVANENEDSVKYSKMHFVEFLEMICRVADVKYKSSDHSKLHKKIEVILDELIVVLGKKYKRREVQI